MAPLSLGIFKGVVAVLKNNEIFDGWNRAYSSFIVVGPTCLGGGPARLHCHPRSLQQRYQGLPHPWRWSLRRTSRGFGLACQSPSTRQSPQRLVVPLYAEPSRNTQSYPTESGGRRPYERRIATQEFPQE